MKPKNNAPQNASAAGRAPAPETDPFAALLAGLDDTPVSDRDFELIQHCMEDLYLARLEFPRRFYARLFAMAPKVEALFTHDRTRQNLMLYAVMTMVVSYLRNGRDPRGELAPFGRRHQRAGVTEDMFPVFGQAFLETMVEFLPHRDSTALAHAWSQTYGRIAEGVIAGMRTADAVSTPVPLFRQPPVLRAVG